MTQGPQRIYIPLVIAAALFAAAPTQGHAQQTHGGRTPLTARALNAAAPAGPTAYIDTTAGRLTCKLFSSQAPLTVARFSALASGALDWTDYNTNTVVHGKPFYDAVAIGGVSGGLITGDRLGAHKGEAGPPLHAETNKLAFDKPGLLIMSRRTPDPASPNTELESASSFYILRHGNEEYAHNGTIFGQCDAASLPIIDSVAHTLLSTDNHPATAIAINHITITTPGTSAPPLASNVPAASMTPQPVPLLPDPIAAPEPNGPTALIDTTMGPINCRLFKETPVATANFIALANGTKDWKLPRTQVTQHHRRFYDGLTFGRVLPDFMVQNADMPGDPGGDGDIGFHFAVEAVPGLSFDRPGRLAYANGGPDTNQSEFFVTEHAVHRLDANYTIFGQCDAASVAVVEAIARVPRDAHNRPLKPVVIRKITIQP
jgi:cyclophilin family peptidyl-prolyl cis-trans isomerase